jgi:hypothetical protein
MKTTILAAFAILSLALGAAYAEPTSHAAPQPSGNQSDWTVGGAGWG